VHQTKSAFERRRIFFVYIEKQVLLCYNKSKKGGTTLKKGVFNGNIKREFVSYIWISILLGLFIFLGVGCMILYSSFQHEPHSIDRIGLATTGILFILVGILLFVLDIFVIRKYPKYPKLRSKLFNSDCYFVGNDSKDYRGIWYGKASFSRVNQLAEQNADLQDLKYPKRYKIFIVLFVVAMLCLFANLFITGFVLKNIGILPIAFQNEGLVFAAFVVLEILVLILCFILAFKIKKTREMTIEKYRTERKENLFQNGNER
jgi:biotin transporter BioY